MSSNRCPIFNFDNFSMMSNNATIVFTTAFVCPILSFSALCARTFGVWCSLLAGNLCASKTLKRGWDQVCNQVMVACTIVACSETKRIRISLLSYKDEDTESILSA